MRGFVHGTVTHTNSLREGEKINRPTGGTEQQFTFDSPACSMSASVPLKSEVEDMKCPTKTAAVKKAKTNTAAETRAVCPPSPRNLCDWARLSRSLCPLRPVTKRQISFDGRRMVKKKSPSVYETSSAGGTAPRRVSTRQGSEHKPARGPTASQRPPNWLNLETKWWS